MTSLMHAELRRLAKRRFTWWMLAIVVLVAAAIATTTWLSNQQHTDAAFAAAEQHAEEAYQNELVWHQQWVEQELNACRQARDSGAPEDEFRWPEDCEEIATWEGPQREWFEATHFLPPTFDFRDQFPHMITALTALLALLGFLVGASFVGAEWRSGSMMNLLLWRPRRIQVLGAKLGTVVAALLALTVLLGGVWTAVFWQVATHRGVTDTMTAGAWQSFGLTGLRATALVLAAGALGVALASVGRHTVTALGAAVAAFVVGVIGVSIAVFSAGVRYAEAWLWPTYLQAWLQGSVVLQDWQSCDFRAGECVPPTLEITWQVAGAGIAAVVALVVGAAMWHIRTRDVT